MTKDVVQSRRYVIRNRLSKYKLACISQSQSHNLTIRSWIAITNLFLSVHIISDSPDSTKIAIVVIMQGKTERGIRMEGAKSQERFEGNVHHSSLLESNHLNPPYWTDFTGSHPPSHHRATHLDGGFVRECACARRSSDPFRFVSVCCLLFAVCQLHSIFRRRRPLCRCASFECLVFVRYFVLCPSPFGDVFTGAGSKFIKFFLVCFVRWSVRSRRSKRDVFLSFVAVKFKCGWRYLRVPSTTPLIYRSERAN